MRTILITILILLATSCSGSGSSGSAAVAPPAFVSADVVITPDNALAAAQAGIRGCFDLIRLSYIGAHFLQTSIMAPAGSIPGEPVEPPILGGRRSLNVDGPQGGSATFSWDDLDAEGTYTSGDLFTISFDNYGDEGMVLQGVMTIDNVDLQGLLPGDGTYLLDADLNFIGLIVRHGASEQVFTTTLPFHMENRLIVEIFDLFLFEAEVVDAHEVQANTRLIRYETDEKIRFQFEGAVHSIELEGTVRFATPTFMVGSTFQVDPSLLTLDPTEGTLIVSGANRSSIEIEPTCLIPGLFCSLDIRVDEDGDEEYEQTLSSSWAGLLPQ